MTDLAEQAAQNMMEKVALSPRAIEKAVTSRLHKLQDIHKRTEDASSHANEMLGHWDYKNTLRHTRNQLDNISKPGFKEISPKEVSKAIYRSSVKSEPFWFGLTKNQLKKGKKPDAINNAITDKFVNRNLNETEKLEELAKLL